MGQAVKEKRKYRAVQTVWRRGGRTAGAAAAAAAFCRRTAQKCLPWAEPLGLVAASVLAGAASLPFGTAAVDNAVHRVGQMAPFGLALCLAVPVRWSFLCCVGCALGGFLVLPVPAAVQQAAAALTVGVLRTLEGRRATVWPALVSVVVSSFLCQGFSAVGAVGTGGPGVWLPQSCLMLALAILYRQVGRGGRDLLRSPAAALAVWTSILCCFGALPGPVPWMCAAAGFAMLLAAASQCTDLYGLLWVGTALSALLLQQNMGLAVVAVCAGWCAGEICGRSGNRKAMAGVCFCMGMLGVFAAKDLIQLAWFLAAHGLGCGLYTLMPQKWLDVLADSLAVQCRVDTETPARTLTALARGLEAIAGGVEVVGHASTNEKDANDPDMPIRAATRQVCGGCRQKALCWGSDYDHTQDVLQHFLARWRTDCTGEFASHFHCLRPDVLRSALLRAENLRVLRNAEQVENGVLRRAVSDQYRALGQGLCRMAQSWQPDTPQPRWENRIAALATGLQLPLRSTSAVLRPDGTPSITLTLRPVQLGKGGLTALAKELGRICGTPLTGTALPQTDELLRLQFTPAPSCSLRGGAVCRGYGGGICGDVTEQLCCGETVHFLLCDGMGTGRTAALDAKMTALFTARLLRAGFAGDIAARLVNAALLARAPGDRGSTLDLASVCLRDGGVQLYKAGACAAFLCREGSVQRFGADGMRQLPTLGLPLGSAETVQGVMQSATLAVGDLLVLASDGVLAAGEGPLLRALQPYAVQPPAPDADLQQLAAALLDAVFTAAQPQDDSTLLLIQVNSST